MKLAAVFRFELTLQLRRATAWLCFALLLGFTAATVIVSRPTAGEVLQNGPFSIAFFTVVGGVLWLLIAPSVAGEAAARDVATRMHPLVFSAPLGRTEYLGGRLLAALVVNAALLLAVPLGIVVGVYAPVGETALRGPFWPAAYLTAYGVIALPLAVVATSVQFCAATLTRRPMGGYLASVLLLFTSHFVLLTVAGLLERWELVPLLDLVGIAGITAHLGDTWTAAEQNTRLVGLEPTLLLNRVIWLAVAAALLASTWLRFRLAHPAESARRAPFRRRSAPSPSPAPAAPRTRPVVVPPVPRTFGFGTRIRQVAGIGWTSFGTIARSRLGLTLVALFALHLVVFMPDYMEFFEVPLLPVTERILGSMTAALTDVRTPLVVIPLLIAFHAGELFWRERDAGVSDVADAAPVAEWVLLAGKLLGLGMVIVAWLSLLAAGGMLGQLAMGYRDLEPALYLKILFGLQLPPYLLFACLALTIHVVVNHRYAGHIACLLALAFIGFASAVGVRHDLLVFGAGPGWSYTGMRGFGGSVEPWLWFRSYWAAWALLLAVAAGLLWPRGRESGLAARLRGARRRFTRRTGAAAAAALGLILVLGGFIVYNTHVLNAYETAADRAEDAAEYERRYGRFRFAPQPLLAATELHVEIFPAERQVEIRGTYRAVNRSGVAIDSIHLATAPGVRTGAVVFDRPATRVLADEELGHRIYALGEPLLPGDSLTLRFGVRYEQRGFRSGGVGTAVVANGTTFANRDWLPAIGYQPQRELRGAAERRAHALPRAATLPGSLGDEQARRHMGGAELIRFEAVVGTSPDQVAVAPGALRRTWTEGGRRYFHYAADAPIRNQYRFFSARYEVHRARWNDVAIEIFHHPGHTAHLERMVRSAQFSLAHFTEQFGPYPHRHLRFVERAGGEGGMSADDGSVAYDEGFAHFNPGDPSEGLDLPFYVVAHEVAHQWWGGRVAPAPVEGFWLMTESLAVFSGMQVLREAYGDDQLRRYLALVRSIYAFPRSRAAAPLLRADESFLGYRKGPVALYALGHYIGEDRVNAALRRLVEQHATGAPPLPTSLDLYRELQAVTPDSLRPLLHDLFEANTFWELRTEQAVAEPADDGRWRVTLQVHARKVVVDEAGAERELPMNDGIEIGVFAAGGGGADGGGEALHLRKHRLRSGAQTITVTVPRRPARAGIDPRHLLIDLAPDDNVLPVRQSGAGPTGPS